MQEVTIFNEFKFRKEFCKLVSHSMSCVTETIDTMLKIMAETTKAHNILLESAHEQVYNNMTVEVFDEYIIKLLSVKECDCVKPHTN